MQNENDIHAKPKYNFGIWLIIFPITYAIHIAEELWGGEGYSAYLYRLRGVHLSITRFLVLQSIGFLLMVIGVILARVKNFQPFLMGIFGGLAVANGTSHTITAIWDGGYGPGLVSSFLWIPLGIAMLFYLRGKTRTKSLIISASIGIGINLVVALLTLRGGKVG